MICWKKSSHQHNILYLSLGYLLIENQQSILKNEQH